MRRTGTGYAYWYRVYYPVPGKQSEEIVGKESDAEALQSMRDQIAFSEWVSAQVSNLRKLGFQVADKPVARVLVELHNQGAFQARLVLVGTLSYMAWLNELGAMAVSARTLDIDLARRQQLKLAAPLSFMTTMQATVAMVKKIRPLYSKLLEKLNAHVALQEILRKCLKPGQS